MDVFWAAPPVTRTFTAAALGTSLLVYGGVLDGRYVVFYMPWVFKFPVPELWRAVTAFLVTGPRLDILFDAYFLWTYGSSLEDQSPRFAGPGDFFVYILFTCSIILATAGGMLGGMIFTHALTLALAYTYAQDNRGKKVSVFVITFNVMWLPVVMLLMTFVQAGPGATFQQSMGLLAAHMYDFLTRLYPTFGGGRNVIKTPAFIQKWFNADRRRNANTGFGTAYRPGLQQQQQRQQSQRLQQPGRSSGNSLSSGLSDIWSSRGQGHRLGGD